MAYLTRAAPFVWLAAALAGGIWFAAQFPTPLEVAIGVIVIALAVALVAMRGARAVAWWAMLAALFGAGMARYTLALPRDTPESLIHANGYPVILEGVVSAEPDVRPDDTRLRVRVNKLVVEGAVRPDLERELGVGDVALIKLDNSIAWHLGDGVRVEGVLDAPPVIGAFDYRDYLAQRGVRSWMPRANFAERTGQGFFASVVDAVYAAILRLKNALRESTNAIMPAPESALLNGILIGDDNALPDSIKEAFKCTGTAHIIAISGFNVSIFFAVLVAALGGLLNKRAVAVIAIPVILFYTVLVGASASVVRAAFMAILVLIGSLFWRRGFTMNTLCAAAFIMLALNPNTLFDAGFQLSFAATLGLVLYADRLMKHVHRWLEARVKRDTPRRALTVLGDALLTTVAATLASLPLLTAYFNSFSTVALPTNMMVLWMQPAAMIVGMLASVVGLVSASLGTLIGLPAYALLSATIRIIEGMAGIPNACVPVYGFGAPQAVAYYGLMLVGTAYIAQSPERRGRVTEFARKHALGLAGATLAAIALTVGLVVWLQRPDGKLHVVLSGNGAFVQTPSGKQLVFAGGGDTLSVMGRAMPIWDNGVELFVLPQRSDRARGNALPMLQRYRVGALLMPQGNDEPSARLDEWNAAVRDKAGQMLAAPIGTRVLIEPGVSLVIEPSANGNVGARLTFGDVSVALVGDSDIISGTLRADDIVFANPRDRNLVANANAVAPRWVVWADAGPAPSGLDPKIKSLALRDVGQVEFVTDGKSLVVRQ